MDSTTPGWVNCLRVQCTCSCGNEWHLFSVKNAISVRLKSRHISRTHTNQPTNKQTYTHTQSMCRIQTARKLFALYYVILLCYLFGSVEEQSRVVSLASKCDLIPTSIYQPRKSQFQMSIYRPANRTLMSANL